MVWSEETILHLKELWEQGHSTAEIGRRLGVTKNAIVGKAHRLDLTGRPSPIRRDPYNTSAERPPTLRVAGTTLPPLASAMTANVVQPIRSMGAPPPAPATVLRPVASPTTPTRPFATAVATQPPPVRAVSPPPSYNRRTEPSCCWPIGEPGKKDFHFCDDPSLPGKPYCDEHAKLAYVKIRDRKDDAA